MLKRDALILFSITIFFLVNMSLVVGIVDTDRWTVSLTSISYTNASAETFKCSVTEHGVNATLTNVTLFYNNSGSWKESNASNTSWAGINVTSNLSTTLIQQGDIGWNCFAFFRNSTGQNETTYASSNGTIIRDSIAPEIANTSLYRYGPVESSNTNYSGTIDVNVSIVNSTGAAYNTSSPYHLWINWTPGGLAYTEVTIDDRGVSSGRLSGNFDTTTVTDGSYNISIIVNETGDTKNDSVPFNITNVTIDNTNPSITLGEPSDTSIKQRDSIAYTCSGSPNNGGNVVSFSVEITKPVSGDKVSKSGSSVTFSGDDTQEVGTYNIKCSGYEDIALKRSGTSATKTFTVDDTSKGGGGGESGGESGGGAVFFDIDFSKVDSDTLLRKVDQEITFTFDGDKEYSLTVDSIEDGKVTVTLSSGQTLTLSAGETKGVDLDGDGTNNVNVGADDVFETSARFTLTELAAPRPVEVPPPREVPPGEEPTRGVTPGEEVMAGEEKKGIGGTLLTIIIIVIIIVAAYYGITAYQKKKRWPLK